MEQKITVTPQMISKADSFVPLEEKVQIAEKIAEKCRNIIRIGTAAEAERMTALPDLYAENAERKARFLLGTLAKKYLRIDFDGAEGEDLLLALDDYNRLAGSHIVNQVERMKSDKDVRDKCFDILQDYKALEKMVNMEIYTTIQMQNDPVTRFMAYMQSATTPQAMQDAQADLERLRNELEQYSAGKRSEGIAES